MQKKDITLQIQTVLYHNDKDSLFRSLDSFSNAIDVNRRTSQELGKVCFVYGDASKDPLFSEDEITEICLKYQEEFSFKYIFFNENTGTSRGHNKMFKECSSDYVLLMNPDIIPVPRFFHNMFRAFLDSDRKAGLVEARQTPIEHPKEYDLNTFEISWGSGACSLVKSRVFKQIGGYDEKTFFMYCDDVDCSWRIRLAGYKLYYCPDAPIFHAKKLSCRGGWQPTSAEKYYSAEAALLLNYKYSNNKHCQELIQIYQDSGDSDYMKAVKRFLKLRQSGNLPTQIDPNHKVATFVENNYSEHRFSL